jgi:hypothetical protein
MNRILGGVLPLGLQQLLTSIPFCVPTLSSLANVPQDNVRANNNHLTD